MMFFLIHLLFPTKVLHTASMPIQYECPRCLLEMTHKAYTEVTITKFLGVQISREESHKVYLSCCAKPMSSKLAPQKLATLAATEIANLNLITEQISIVRIMLLIAAYSLFCTPIGLIFLFFAWVPDGSHRAWFRVACKICLFMNIIFVNLVLFYLMIAQKK